MTGGTRAIDALTRVIGIVKERERQHGDAIHQHVRLAKLWSAYLGMHVSATDAAVLLALLKISRIAESVSPPQDSYDDAVGYAAIASALAEASRRNSDLFIDRNLEGEEVPF